MFGLSQEKRQAVDASAESGTEPSAEVQMERNVMVEDVSLTGLSRTEALQKLQETYAWGMTVVCDGETYEVPDLMSGRIEELLNQIYQRRRRKPPERTRKALPAIPRKSTAWILPAWKKKWTSRCRF